MAANRKIPSLIRFFRKPFSTQKLMAEAFLLVALFRLVIFFLPFKAFTRLIGSPRALTPGEKQPAPDKADSKSASGAASVTGTVENTDAGSEFILPVVGAVMTVSRHVPWESQCLVRAAAAKIMLRRRGIAGTLYLGVRRDGRESGEMKPHAWLTVGPDVIYGGGELDRYIAVSAFS